MKPQQQELPLPLERDTRPSKEANAAERYRDPSLIDWIQQHTAAQQRCDPKT
jgi:hypothetical protein